MWQLGVDRDREITIMRRLSRKVGLGPRAKEARAHVSLRKEAPQRVPAAR
jgi:hypothetical protein